MWREVAKPQRPQGGPGPPGMELSLPQAGAKSGLQTLDPRMAQLVGSLLPHLLGQIIWSTQRGPVSYPHSHSTCTTVLTKNLSSAGCLSLLPRLCRSQQACCSHPSLASVPWFPQKREGRLVSNCLFLAPWRRQFWILPSLPPPHAFCQSQEHTHVHTSQPLFSHRPPSPCSPLTPRLPGLEGTPKVIWFSSPHSELQHGCLPQDPRQDSSAFFLHISKDRELTTSQDRFLPLDCSDLSISSIHGRGFLFSVALSMTSHVLALLTEMLRPHMVPPEPHHLQVREPRGLSSFLLCHGFLCFHCP